MIKNFWLKKSFCEFCKVLCRDCHYYAPNNKADFEEYVQEKMEGSSTMLFLAFKKFRERYNDEEWKLLEEKAKKEKKI